MFEHGPFKTCPECQQPEALGILSVGGQMLTRRCKLCRHRRHELLPELNKKVIYLDQLGFSEIFKVKSGTRRANAPSQAFWEKAHKAVERVVHMQQAVFPTSNIHSDETTVFNRAVELRQACEMLGGDVSFKNVSDVEGDQFFKFAESFLAGNGVPALTFEAEDVLDDDRNVWLPTLHITTNMDFGFFADDLRKARGRGSQALTDLTEKWSRDKPTFERQLKVELKGWGITLTKQYQELESQRRQAIADGDPDAMAAAALHPTILLLRQIMAKFGVDRADVSQDQRQRFMEFMRWEGLEQLPNHRVGAYLYAALARKYASGQKRPPSPGMMKDFQAISTYGPYVDAMFLDRECAGLLGQEPLKSELSFKGPVFSVATGDAFVAYLHELADNAPVDVKAYAKEIYDVE